MRTEEFIARLTQAFHPAAAEEFDGHVRLDLGDDGAVLLHVNHGSLAVAPAPEDASADFTLYFNDAKHAFDLLTGAADPVAAFMAHEFRADGYLIWVFSVLAMFR